MLNICALFHRIPDGKNYSTQFSCVPVFFCPKTPKLAFLLLRRRSLYLLLLVLFLSFSFATEVPSTRIQAQFPTLSPVRAAGNRANTWYGVRSWTKSILTFHGPPNTSSLRKLFFKLLSVVFVAQVSCLRVVVPLVRFIVLFSSGTAGLSSCREIFLSLQPFPRGVAMGLFRRRVIFKSLLLRFFFSSTELHTRQQ